VTGTATVDIRIAAGDWRACVPDVEALVRDSALSAWSAAAAGGAAEISILLADDATVRNLNAIHRGRDGATNVLSFPANPANGAAAPALLGPVLLGDVVLACETVAAEARAQDKSVADHVRHMIVHGVLHLLGYDHADDATAETMERLEAKVLAGLGVDDPYNPARPAADPRNRLARR
jgi:probable rRNA maturation factor